MKTLDVKPQDKVLLLSLIERYLPHTEIRVYGSRIKGTAKPWSDLDMAALTKPEQSAQVFLLREALEESDLPFRVDLLEWNALPEDFQKTIERAYMVLSEEN